MAIMNPDRNDPGPRPLLWLAAVVAAVPLYGYFVRAPGDPQILGLAIGLCWFVSCFLALGAFIAAAAGMKDANGERRVPIAWAGILVLEALVGYGGAVNAFYELLAG